MASPERDVGLGRDVVIMSKFRDTDEESYPHCHHLEAGSDLSGPSDRTCEKWPGIRQSKLKQGYELKCCLWLFSQLLSPKYQVSVC